MLAWQTFFLSFRLCDSPPVLTAVLFILSEYLQKWIWITRKRYKYKGLQTSSSKSINRLTRRLYYDSWPENDLKRPDYKVGFEAHTAHSTVCISEYSGLFMTTFTFAQMPSPRIVSDLCELRTSLPGAKRKTTGDCVRKLRARQLLQCDTTILRYARICYFAIVFSDLTAINTIYTGKLFYT